MLLHKPNGFTFLSLIFTFINLFHTADFESNVYKISVKSGDNVTLPCPLSSNDSFNQVSWVKQDRSQQISRWRIQKNGSLQLNRVVRPDSGRYMCFMDEPSIFEDEAVNDIPAAELSIVDESKFKATYVLNVMTVPGEVTNLTVHASTVLALVMWEPGDSGGSTIIYYFVQYRLKFSGEVWHDILQPKIAPSVRKVDVYRLSPNSTYVFRVWAENESGMGPAVQVEATTKHVDQEKELAKHLLEGAEKFDTRVWVVAVAIVMGTLLVLSAATGYLFCKDCRTTSPIWHQNDQEIMELVPNIILNPGFLEDADFLETTTTIENGNTDENGNHRARILINNNSIVRPVRV